MQIEVTNMQVTINNIEQLRRYLNLKQSDLGMTSSNYNFIIKGKISLTAQATKKIADIMDIDEELCRNLIINYIKGVD